MNKFKGKALSLVLSLALVISSFSAVPASASTKTLSGSLSGIDHTSFYLVNGGTDDAGLTYQEFGTAISDAPTMTTPDHEDVSEVHIAAISHKSGDRLVKWYDSGSDGTETDSIDSDTDDKNIDLKLRSSSVSGEEVLSVLYKGTYTDDDDNEYTVKATKDVTVRVYDKDETVIGEYGDAGEDDVTGSKGELDSNFAQKTVAYEKAKKAATDESPADTTLTDSKKLTVLKAVPSGEAKCPLVVKWEVMKTSSDDTYLSDDTAAASKGVYYVLKSNSSNVDLDKGQQSASKSDKAATAGKAGISFSETGFTVKKTTLDGANIQYYYTTDGKTPALNDAGIPEAGTTLVTDCKITLAEADSGKTVTVLGFDSTSRKAVTDVVSGKYTYAGEGGANSTFTTEDGTATLTAPGIAFTESSTTELTVAPVATPNYFYSVNDGAWAAATADTEVYYTTALGDALAAGATIKVEAAATVSNSVPAEDPDETVEGSYTKAITTSDDSDFVTAQVAPDAGTGKVTFTAEATKVAEDATDDDATDHIYSSSDLKEKVSVTKTIKVDSANSSYNKLSKYSTSTYLFTSEVDKGSKDDAIKVNGYEVNFDDPTVSISVDDKASVTEISGVVGSVSIESGNVGSLDIDNDDDGTPSVTISDAKVGDIDFDDDGGNVTVDSTDSVVGNITDASTVKVTNGTVGSIDADKADISAEDEDHTVSVGDVTAAEITVDSDNSKVSTGTLTATSDDTEITLSGDFVTVKAIDFDNYGAELKIDGFVGSIPAPKNATKDGATLSTNATDDKVTVNGAADINCVSIGDDSQVIFDNTLNVGSIDGSGTLVVGLGKMNITSDASGVTLKFSNSTLNKGDTAFTAVTDTVDEDSMENFGFTLSKTEGSKTDTFKIASTTCVGVSFGSSSAEIAKGYTQTFKASAYAPGTSLPEGYTVDYTLDGDDDVFEMVKNDDGTVTIKVVGYDDTFAEENKATLTADVVDADGDVDDDYAAGEVDLTAIATPTVSFTSDTAVKNMKVGESYRFRITSADGSQPSNFVVASNAATVTYRGNSGKDYFYDVKAVKTGSYGVYVAGPKLAVLNITNAFTIDTKTVSVNAGASYQFKVTGPSQPRFQVAGVGDIKLTSKSGNNYFFKVTVPSNLAKGGHGVYVNGVAMAVVTVK